MNNKTSLIQPEQIEQVILLIRGQRVMLDRDLAALYGVETKNLNKALRRNPDRFPADFMFQLTEEEVECLRFQFGTLKRGQNINLKEASAMDKAVVRPLAERLRKDGQRNESQPSTINPQPLGGSVWVRLACPAVASARRRKAGTFRFRDPLNKGRRFIPLRLDDVPILYRWI